MIDLRSDTVTKPTTGMMEAMMTAEVGDDVFGDDPSVNALQEKVAGIFGTEEALFCPSGTMANQIALRVNTNPQEEVICDKRSHIYLYEGGGLAYNSMLSPKLLDGNRGRLTASMIESAINPKDIHFPPSTLVSVENTMNKGGGAVYDFEELKKISALCKTKNMKLHLDGARLFNALVKTGDDAKAYGPLFDTISICFSKGLGAPVGSAVLGSRQTIKQAKRVRKVLGGAMRQAGYLAAAASYALDHHVERLQQDHIHAEQLGKALKSQNFVSAVEPVDTNIVIAYLEGITPDEYLIKLEKSGILAVAFGPNAVRFVTHIGIDENAMSQVLNAIA
ncbi:MAG: GntG family PLP-dependent aldolase [Cyclobacteriaceae bacterium]